MAPRSVASVNSILLSIKLLSLCKHFSHQNFSTILNPMFNKYKIFTMGQSLCSISCIWQSNYNSWSFTGSKIYGSIKFSCLLFCHQVLLPSLLYPQRFNYHDVFLKFFIHYSQVFIMFPSNYLCDWKTPLYILLYGKIVLSEISLYYLITWVFVRFCFL